MQRKISLIIVLVLISLAPSMTWAWSSDPTVNTPICTAVETQNDPAIVHDGTGGAIIAWADLRDQAYVYAQSVDAAGTPQWATDGIAIAENGYYEPKPKAVSDGSGGAIIVWIDDRNGALDLYAQRIDANGESQWAQGGVPFLILSSNFSYWDDNGFAIISDGNGGAIGVAGGHPQRIDANGVVQWGAQGLVFSAEAVASDGDGGAIIAWVDYHDDNWNIYAQRVNAEGITQWTDASTVYLATLVPGEMPEARLSMIGDDQGGAIIAWTQFVGPQDTHPWNMDIFAQKIDGSGNIQWPAAGVPVCTTLDAQSLASIVKDSQGGAIIVWEDIHFDDLTGPDPPKILGQRVTDGGAIAWAAAGVPLFDSGYFGNTMKMISDNAGGAIIAAESYNIVTAQRLSNSGMLPWGTTGVEICTAESWREAPVITTNSNGGAIIAWADNRNDNDLNIYAQAVSADGALSGLQAPSNLTPVDYGTTTATPELTASEFEDSTGLLTHAASQWRVNDFNSISPEEPEINLTSENHVIYQLPFDAPFPFFGRQITAISINPHGLIELLEEGENSVELGQHTTHAEGRHIGTMDAIFASNDWLYLPVGGYIKVYNQGSQVMIEWYACTFADDTLAALLNFQVILSENGSIGWVFKEMNFANYSGDMYSGLYPNNGSEINVGVDGHEIRGPSAYVFDPTSGQIFPTTYYWPEPQPVEYDSGETATDLVSHFIPESAHLNEGRTYFWAVRYKADNDEWTGWSDLTRFTVAAIPPSVLFTGPADSDTNVPVNRALTAFFNKAMNPVTITPSCFTLSGLDTNEYTVDLSADGRHATLTPNATLDSNTTYTATITTGATDLTGQTIAPAYPWTFTTGTDTDMLAPSVVLAVPDIDATDVAIDIGSVDLTFSEPINGITITNASFSVSDFNGAVTGTATYANPETNTARFQFQGGLAYSTTYTVTITTAIEDLAGNAMAFNYSWDFSTVQAPPGPDGIAPRVVSYTPSPDGVQGIPVVNAITATFSEPMVATDFNDATFTVSDSIGLIAGTFFYDPGALTAWFQPDAPLEYNTLYTVWISEHVHDLAGNGMNAEETWTFTSSADPSDPQNPCDPENGEEEGCPHFDEFTFGTGVSAHELECGGSGAFTEGAARQDVSQGVTYSEQTYPEDVQPGDQVYKKATATVNSSTFHLYCQSIDKTTLEACSTARSYIASKIEVLGVPWNSLVPMRMDLSPNYPGGSSIGSFDVVVYDFDYRSLAAIHATHNSGGYMISRISWPNPFDQETYEQEDFGTSSVLGRLDFMYPNTPNNGIYVWMGTSASKTSEPAGDAEMECDAYLAVDPAPGVTVTLPTGLDFVGEVDSDGDGVSDSIDIEPYDASVASVPVANDPTETVAITLDDSLTGGITLSQCESMNPWDPGIVQTDRPPNEAIPYGLFSFQVNGIIPGGQIEVLLTFPDNLSPGARYFKVDAQRILRISI